MSKCACLNTNTRQVEGHWTFDKTTKKPRCVPSGLRRGGSTPTSGRWWCPSTRTVPWTSTAATWWSSIRAASCTRGPPTCSPSLTLLTRPWRGGTKTLVLSSQVTQKAPCMGRTKRTRMCYSLHISQETTSQGTHFFPFFLVFILQNIKKHCNPPLLPLILRCYLSWPMFWSKCPEHINITSDLC